MEARGMNHHIAADRVDTPWGPMWMAWSTALGVDRSPIGIGDDKAEAIADLEPRLPANLEDAA